MSNFNCEKCGMPIVENLDGIYQTYCQHYPLEVLNEKEEYQYFIKIGTFEIKLYDTDGVK